MPAAQITRHLAALLHAGSQDAARFVASALLGLFHAVLLQVILMTPGTGPRKR